jgi:hypothetical protein
LLFRVYFSVRLKVNSGYDIDFVCAVTNRIMAPVPIDGKYQCILTGRCPRRILDRLHVTEPTLIRYLNFDIGPDSTIPAHFGDLLKEHIRHVKFALSFEVISTSFFVTVGRPPFPVPYGRMCKGFRDLVRNEATRCAWLAALIVDPPELVDLLFSELPPPQAFRHRQVS